MTEELKNKIDNLRIGAGIVDVRLGMSTRQVERVSKNRYVINDFVDGWQQAKVDRKTLDGVIDGNISLLDLDWY